MSVTEKGYPFQIPYGENIRAEGHCIHRARSLAFREGEVYDGEGLVAARASGTFKYVRLREDER